MQYISYVDKVEHEAKLTMSLCIPINQNVSVTLQDRQFTFEDFTENKSVFVAGCLIIWVLEQLSFKKGNPKAYPKIEF